MDATLTLPFTKHAGSASRALWPSHALGAVSGSGVRPTYLSGSKLRNERSRHQGGARKGTEMSKDSTTQALAGITWLSEQTPEALREMLRKAPSAERRELLDTMARVYTVLGEVLRLATPAPRLNWTSSEAQGG